MILSKTLKIKITNKTITYYKQLGFDKVRSGDIITINSSQLSKGSHEIIVVDCDECHNAKNIEFKTYYILTNGLNDKYYCNKCKTIKTKITNLKKYGVDNVFKSEKIKNKIKKIKKSKYNNEYYNNIEKQKQTNLEKYGVSSCLKKQQNQHNKNINKLKETFQKKHSILFLKKSSLIHGDNFEFLSPYINMSTKIEIKCKKCNNIFYQRPKDHIHKKEGCPYCKQSKGERSIKLFLDTNNIKYEIQKSFENCKYKRKLKFDFYLSDYNCCIEYDGGQHFKKFNFEKDNDNLNIRQLRDNIKNNFCEKNNINLIRIKYDETIIKLQNYIENNIIK